MALLVVFVAFVIEARPALGTLAGLFVIEADEILDETAVLFSVPRKCKQSPYM